jgi:hypothetical protein
LEEGMVAIYKKASYLSESQNALAHSFDAKEINDGLIRRRLSLATNNLLCMSLYLNNIIQVARTVCGELNKEKKKTKILFNTPV